MNANLCVHHGILHPLFEDSKGRKWQTPRSCHHHYGPRRQLLSRKRDHPCACCWNLPTRYIFLGIGMAPNSMEVWHQKRLDRNKRYPIRQMETLSAHPQLQRDQVWEYYLFERPARGHGCSMCKQWQIGRAKVSNRIRTWKVAIRRKRREYCSTHLVSNWFAALCPETKPSWTISSRDFRYYLSRILYFSRINII